MSDNRGCELAAVGVLCTGAAVMLTYVGMADFRADDGATLDNRQYTAMALGHGGEVIKPFHYRVAVPAIVRLFPQVDGSPTRSAQLGFAAVDVVALTIAGVALYLLLRAWKAQPLLALVGVLGFYLTHSVMRFATVPLVESSAFAVVIVAMLAAEKRKQLLFALVVLTGMFVKETTAIVLLYPLLMSGPLAQRARLAACAIPGIVAYGAFRLLDPVSGYSYGPTDWLHNLTALTHSLDAWRTIVLAFGPWWLLLAVALRPGADRGLIPSRFLWMVAAAWAAAVVLSTDYERVLFLTFPIVLATTLPTVGQWLGSGLDEGSGGLVDRPRHGGFRLGAGDRGVARER